VSGATCCCCLLGKNAFLWAQKLSRKKKALRLQLFDEKMFKLVSQEKQMVYLGNLQLYTFIQLSQIGCTLVQSCGGATMSISKAQCCSFHQVWPIAFLITHLCTKGSVVVLVIRNGQWQMYLLHFFITHLHKKGV
jgi:hypothetical protein